MAPILRISGNRQHLCVLILLSLLVLAGCARNSPADDVAPAVVPVANKSDLTEAIGKEITVSGQVSSAGKSKSGHVFLNFGANPQFTIFIDSKVVRQFKDVDPKTYANKTVLVRGRVEKFQDKLQIRLQSPAQITIADAKPDAGGNAIVLPKAVELKPLGKDGWISPAGVRYVGKDPNGDTRKDHVLRHAKDIPDRQGPHGVFDGGEDLTFAWIDEAWRKIKTDRIRPETENGRDVYSVPMGCRVGFLGGKTGAERKHPPLTMIFLVVREGTSEVITAFPR